MPEDLTREELLRLYKGDIEKDVAESVEKRLIKRYSIAAFVAVSIISAISGGFYVFASMLVERQVGAQVDDELNERAKQIDDLTREQRDRLADIADKRAQAEVTLDVATKTAAKAELKLTELETARAELEQRIQGLTGTIGDFEKSVNEATDRFNQEIDQQHERSIALKTELADATAQLEPLKQTLATVSELSSQVESLTETIGRLAAVPESRPGAVEPEELTRLAETRERVSAIATQSAQTYETAQRPKHTVFFQFSGEVTREQAKEIAANLVQRGYVVPGEERAASDSRQVRYFYSEDADLARQVAADTEEIMASMGWRGIDVEPVSMVDWEGETPAGYGGAVAASSATDVAMRRLVRRKGPILAKKTAA